MALKNQPTQLNGINPLSYLGVNPYTPSGSYTQPRAPTPADNDGFQILDFWMDSSSVEHDLYYLAAKNLNGAKYAVWEPFGGGDLETLTGDVGGPVGPDGAHNINTLGTAGQILVTGNPGTNTLTWSLDGSVATQYTEDAGIAIPVAGNLNILGAGGIATSGAGDTVTIDTDGTVATEYVENSGSAIPALGILNVLGDTGITTTGFGNTITIDVEGEVALSYPTDSGTAVPAANVLNIFGGTAGRDINTTGSGNTVRVHLNNAITVGDLSNIVGSAAVTATTGDVTVSSGRIRLSSGTNAAGTIGTMTYGGERFISNFGTLNMFVGPESGNFTNTGIQNTGVGRSCLAALTSGINNNAFGLTSGLNITSGSNNVLLGQAGTCVTTGSSNTMVGEEAGCNVAGGTGVTTGSFNILIGDSAADNYTSSESNNIIIGSLATVGESNKLRIGQATGAGTRQLNKAFICGIRGITTDVNDAVAVLVDSANQLGTVSSSIRYKENVNDMGSSSDVLMKLRPVTFNYKNDESKSTRFGLIAEEVKEVFPYLAVHNADGEVESVKYHEIAAILLNEVQKLEKRVRELENR